MTSTYIPMPRRKIIGLVLITSLATFSLLNCRVRPTRLDREHVPGPLAAKSLFSFFSKTPPAAPIDWERSLLIRNPVVVDDTEYACDVYRATNTNAQAPCPLDNLGKGPLTFAAAFKSLTAPKTGQAAAWMDVFQDAFGAAIHKSWSLYSPSLLLEYAPFRLLAVVYRPDLARDRKSGGEVRLVFCAYDYSGLVVNIDFYVIFEFAVTVHNWDEFKTWAGRWADLSKAPPSAAAVKSLVEAGIANSGGRKLRVNYSRGGAWQMLEFTPQIDGTLLPPDNLTATPAHAANCKQDLTDWISSQRQRYLNEDAPVAATVSMPLATDALVYSADFAWTPYHLSDNTLRSAFALSTCNGCHASETNVGFAHIAKREIGKTAAVSNFLLPVIVPKHTLTSPCDSSQVIVDKRDFADLDRRIKIMEKIFTSVSFEDFQSPKQSIKLTRQVH